ncbi:MAG: hypothetical protein IPM71_06680 [Bacteroidota bacterium]|nr:MAG: hypothetical protein IPM71_06680 [Bacteroidota bacterium]
MLLKVFRENQPFTILILVLLMLVTGFMVIAHKSYVPFVHNQSSYALFYLLPGLHTLDNYPVISTVLNLSLLFISGFYLTRITIRYQLLGSRSLMPLLIFVVLSLPFFISYRGFSYVLLSIPVFLFTLDSLFRASEQKSLSYAFFNAPLILSIASMFNPFLLFFQLYVLFLLFRLRGQYWRELVFLVLGALWPYAILFALMFLTDVSFKQYFAEAIKLIKSGAGLDLSLISWIAGGFYSTLFLISSWKALNDFVKMKIIVRRLSLLFLFLFLFPLAILLLWPTTHPENLLLVAVPLSYLFSYYFSNCRINLLNQVLFVLFLLTGPFIFFNSLLPEPLL